jgi:peroxiredoxin
MFWLDTGEEKELEELLEDGPVLLLFYLFDWSPT